MGSKPNYKSVKLDSKLYNKLVKKIEFSAIRLVELKFDLKPKYVIVAANEDKAAKIKFQLQDGIGELRKGSDGGEAVYNVTWKLVAKYGREHLVSISSNYVVFYENTKEFPNEYVREFASRNARTVSYPYFRALVSRIAGESDIDIPTLPMIKLTPHR